MTNMNLANRDQRDQVRRVVDMFITHRGSGLGLNAAELMLIVTLGQDAEKVLRERCGQAV
jgi:hypothetical protein